MQGFTTKTLVLFMLGLCVAALANAAEDTAKTGTVTGPVDGMLVLDASGSMWGQIAGRHKILIARDVVGDLLNNLPSDHRLGLMAYGHNRKGDCTDIELVAPVGADRERIRETVNSLRPLGMTPLSAAVQQAANTLRYTKVPATVVLVSDGEETCDLDPCAVGRELESAGVDFTAHVIGFDLSTPKQRQQLQCLAEATGGTYNDAANADELSDALHSTLDTVTQPQAAAPKILLQASDLEDGPVVEVGLRWTVRRDAADSDHYASAQEEGSVELPDASSGSYVATVVRPSDGATATAEFSVRDNASKTLTLALEIPLQATVRTEPAATAPAGSDLVVHWEGPAREFDWIGVAAKGAPADQWLVYKYARLGSPVTLRLPIEIAEYEVRYVVGRPTRQLASVPIRTTEVSASLKVAEQAPAGSKVVVEWTGPNYELDWVGVTAIDAPVDKYLHYTYTRQGSPLELQLPPDPGRYEVRYVSGRSSKLLASQSIETTAVQASLDLPESAPAGSAIVINWEGPNYPNDWIGTANPGDGPGKNATYVYTRHGSPAQLKAPATPGDYIVKYVMSKGTKVLVQHPIRIDPVTATLDAPASAAAGSTLVVNWSGPNYANDWVGVARATDGARKNSGYAYTKKGSPLEIRLPGEPGAWELRYIQRQGNQVLARQPLEIVPVAATLNAPASVVAGSEVSVEFTGPDYARDYIAITKVGVKGKRYESSAYTSKGSPAILVAPKLPGIYEIRYVISSDFSAAASRKIEVVAP